MGRGHRSPGRLLPVHRGCDAQCQGAWGVAKWRLLEPGEFARRAQALWITRLLEHARAPIREAAARELGALETLGGDGYAALIEAAVNDRDEDVRAAAKNALAEAHGRQPLRARLRDWDRTAAVSGG